MLSVSGVSKRFGSLEALKPLSVDFLPGEVHAVVGENGAGKSTLMNLLAGFLSPSSGSVTLNGKPLPVGDPQLCRTLGIEMIHQHFKLVPAFTIEENLMLSQLGVGQNSVDPIKAKAKEFGWEIPWSSRVQEVSVGIQQRVEILKSVATDPSVVIFDEPTAVLAPDEVAELIQFLRQLAKGGKIVILIAHKVDEVLAASDRITVLRRGEQIGTVARSETDSRQLVDMMIGGAVEFLSQSTFATSDNASTLEISDLWVLDDRTQNAVQGLSFTVQRGQVVGVGGVDGNGQVELAEALAGVRNIRRGTITVGSTELDWDKTFVGYVPQDRQTDGLAVDLNLVENMAVAALMNGANFSKANQVTKANDLVQQYSIKAKSANDLAKQLSGGNQQKVILARVLDQNPEILVVVNPTRGLDVKAANFVHQKLLEAAESGAYLVVITTDRDELFAITDEQWFLSRGKLYADEKEALAP
jgi:general nucleoside transport system ATP-binding protein